MTQLKLDTYIIIKKELNVYRTALIVFYIIIVLKN